MKYVSTRGTAPELTFEQAMMTGLARDGGLYVPDVIPTLTHEQIADMAGQSYEEIAFTVMRPFIGNTFTDDEFRGLIETAYSGFRHAARAPIKQLDSNHFLMELFHGPTLAFKDFAMQLIGQMFQASLTRSGKRITIVGATSGDTGSAAIEAFRGLKNVDVFILYPHGRVSEVQRRQMTTPTESNVHALAMDGDFDDCQAALKDMFNDFDFRDGVNLAGVNSINWGRVLAQVVYFFSSAVSVGAPARRVELCALVHRKAVRELAVGAAQDGAVRQQLLLPRLRHGGLRAQPLVLLPQPSTLLQRTGKLGRGLRFGEAVSSALVG